jgi:hypothetical protein
MFAILSEEVQNIGLHWKSSACEMLLNPYFTGLEGLTHAVFPTVFGDIPFKITDKLIVLGTALDNRGTYSTSIRHRMACTWASWSGMETYLQARRVPLVQRFRKFYEVCGRCFLYGAGGWVLDTELQAFIDKFEGKFIRKMLCRVPRQGELQRDFEVRMKNLVKLLRDRTRIPPLSLQAIECYFGWGGHTARMRPQELIRLVIHWRPLDWFRRIRALGCDDAGIPVPPMRVGRPVRWESDLFDMCGDAWEALAGDRRTWAAIKLDKAHCKWLDSHRPCGHTVAMRDFVSMSHISPRIRSHISVPGALRSISFVACVDNQQVAEQVLGTWSVASGSRFHGIVTQTRWLLHNITVALCPSRWCHTLPWVLHHRREQNAVADACAELGRARGEFSWKAAYNLSSRDALMLCTDASFKSGEAGFGACVHAFNKDRGSVLVVWAAGIRACCIDNVEAEFEAFEWGLRSFLRWCQSCL